MSGLSRTPGKRVYVNNVSRVRIPSSLPNSNRLVYYKTKRFFMSRRQESNLYFTLRRHTFYPLNYGEIKFKRCVAKIFQLIHA